MAVKKWRRLSNDNVLWGRMLSYRCIAIPEASTHTSEPAMGRNKLAFSVWYTQYAGFTDSYTRMHRAFNRLEKWACKACPHVWQSLAPGLVWVSGESVPVRELLSVVSDSPDMRDFIMAHHIHDGQRRRQRFLEYGLFGSYECYGEVCSLSWLSSRMLQIVDMGRFRILVFAWCHVTRNYLGIVVGCPIAHTQRLLHHVIQLQPQSYRFVDKGLFGSFFVSYVDALSSGHHDVHDNVISLMPNTGPHTSTSYTRGIKITITAMFCADETPRYRVYRYQVTLELIDSVQLGYQCVQLESRHWLVHYANHEYVHANGAGVVGEFPVLSVERPFYRYCSRVEDDPAGLEVVGFEGQFTVVPGSLVDPKGPAIELPVPYIELPIPMEII
ncbi:hypothetical protein IW141_001112 [Coemansia sp. RSA 355]|nr:hypothetical protein IW141_001112 [Coemansia sp. RSA 355]